MSTLSHDEIRKRLASFTGREIRKVYTFADFKASMAFVNRVAALADKMDHHPDILINYSRVTLTLSSHDAGGLTERDFRLAGQIDA
jgi:4a-hydroxytetrahydrobiopterin dehydratase